MIRPLDPNLDAVASVSHSYVNNFSGSNSGSIGTGSKSSPVHLDVGFKACKRPRNCDMKNSSKRLKSRAPQDIYYDNEDEGLVDDEVGSVDLIEMLRSKLTRLCDFTKFTLQSGRHVEDVVIEHLSEFCDTSPSNPLFSMILDLQDQQVKSWFTRDEFQELLRSTKKVGVNDIDPKDSTP